MKGVFMDDYVYYEFSFNFPSIAKQAVSHYHISDIELIIKLENGEVFSYENINKSLRILPDSNSLTEEECRREFAIRLKLMMVVRGMSQTKLSEATGIQQHLISDYTNGKRAPSLYNLDKIAKALNCSLDELRYY
jgi:DNA-binding Xre family transcriptional regulator